MAIMMLLTSASSYAEFKSAQQIVPTQMLMLILKSDKQTYIADEKVSLLLTVKNLGSQGAQLFDGPYLRTRVVFDGKEYKNTGGIAWGGPEAVSPGSQMNIAVELSAYGITKDMLNSGEHSVVVKLNGAISNALSFKIKEK